MAFSLGDLLLALKVDASQFTTGLTRAAAQVDKIKGDLTGAGTALTAGLTVPIAGLAAISVKTFADFDQAMTQSLAIMGDISTGMRQDMAGAAREMAKQTTFSAEQAAESYFFLASAGLDAKTSMEALPVVAKFAQAGMFDMALATDLLTDAQSALGLTIRDDAVKNMEEMVHISDVLVKANVLANATVQQFSEALTNKAGPSIRATGKDVEEGVAVLAAFADQGIKGAEAGTQFGIVLRDLQTKAISNKEDFAELGVSVFDASGEMLNMADIIADLEGLLGNMSDEGQRAALIQLGFSDRSVAATQALLGTSEAIRGYEEKLRSAAGVTDDIAKRQLTSFSSQLTLLKNRLADSAIEIGKALVPMLQRLLVVAEPVLVWIEKAAKGFANLDPNLQLAAVAFAGVVAAAGPVLFVSGQLVGAAGNIIAAWQGLSGAAVVLRGSLGGLTSILPAVTSGLTGASGGLFSLGASAGSTAGILPKLAAAVPGLGSAIAALASPVGIAIGVVAALGAGLYVFRDQIADSRIGPQWKALWDTVQDVTTDVTTSVENTLGKFFGKVQAEWATGFFGLRPLIEAAWNGIGDVFVGSLETLSGILTGALSAMGGSIKTFVGLLTLDFKLAWEGSLDVASSVTTAMADVVQSNIGTIIGVFEKFADAVGASGVASALRGLDTVMEEAFSSAKEFVSGVKESLGPLEAMDPAAGTASTALSKLSDDAQEATERIQKLLEAAKSAKSIEDMGARAFETSVKLANLRMTAGALFEALKTQGIVVERGNRNYQEWAAALVAAAGKAKDTDGSIRKLVEALQLIEPAARVSAAAFEDVGEKVKSFEELVKEAYKALEEQALQEKAGAIAAQEYAAKHDEARRAIERFDLEEFTSKLKAWQDAAVEAGKKVQDLGVNVDDTTRASMAFVLAATSVIDPLTESGKAAAFLQTAADKLGFTLQAVAEKDLVEAEEMLRRVREAFEQGRVSAQDLARATDAYEAARAKVDSLGQAFRDLGVTTEQETANRLAKLRVKLDEIIAAGERQEVSQKDVNAAIAAYNREVREATGQTDFWGDALKQISTIVNDFAKNVSTKFIEVLTGGDRRAFNRSLDEQAAEVRSKLTEAEQDLETSLAEREARYREYVDEVGRTQQELHEEYAEKLESELEKLNDNLAEKQLAYERYVEDVNKTLGRLNEDFKDNIEDERKEVDQSIKDKKKKYERDVQDAKKALERKTADIEAAIRAELAKGDKADQERIAALRRTLDEEREDFRTTQQRKLEDLNQFIREQEAEYEEYVAEQRQRLERETEDIRTEQERRAADHTAYIEDIKKQTEETTVKLREEEAAKQAALQESLEKQRAEYEAFRESAVAEYEKLKTETAAKLDEIAAKHRTVWGDVKSLLNTTLTEAGTAVTRFVTEIITNKLIKSIKDLVTDHLPSLGKALGAVFGIGTDAAGNIVSTSGMWEQITGVGSAGGQVAGTVGGATSAAGSAASGVLGTISMVTGIVTGIATAIASVGSFIKSFEIETGLDAIELNTRKIARVLEGDRGPGDVGILQALYIISDTLQFGTFVKVLEQIRDDIRNSITPAILKMAAGVTIVGGLAAGGTAATATTQGPPSVAETGTSVGIPTQPTVGATAQETIAEVEAAVTLPSSVRSRSGAVQRAANETIDAVEAAVTLPSSIRTRGVPPGTESSEGTAVPRPSSARTRGVPPGAVSSEEAAAQAAQEEAERAEIARRNPLAVNSNTVLGRVLRGGEDPFGTAPIAEEIEEGNEIAVQQNETLLTLAARSNEIIDQGEELETAVTTGADNVAYAVGDLQASLDPHFGDVVESLRDIRQAIDDQSFALAAALERVGESTLQAAGGGMNVTNNVQALALNERTLDELWQRLEKKFVRSTGPFR